MDARPAYDRRLREGGRERAVGGGEGTGRERMEAGRGEGTKLAKPVTNSGNVALMYVHHACMHACINMGRPFT